MSKSNRRLYHRVAVSNAAMLHPPTNIADGECLVKLVDIGMGGASFRGNIRLNPYSSIGLQIFLPNEREPEKYEACAQIHAKIVRVTDDHANGNTYYSCEYRGPVLEEHGVKQLITQALREKADVVPTPSNN